MQFYSGPLMHLLSGVDSEARAQAQAYDPDARRRLQALSLELTGLSAEGVAALKR
jgi:hypothetical protein